MSKETGKKIYPANLRKNRLRKYFLNGMILFAVFSIVKVWQTVGVDQVVLRNQVLRVELKKIQYDNSLLTYKLEFLTGIERIEKLAREKLGFVQARKMNIELNP
ncbi:hypothetical protein JXQ31_15640 [candidate division KSB1 bacterium]|nr:hypothetical protein [candidate division KSB1 bacterium]